MRRRYKYPRAAEDTALAWLLAHDGWHLSPIVADAIGRRHSNVASTLGALYAAGLVERRFIDQRWEWAAL